MYLFRVINIDTVFWGIARIENEHDSPKGGGAQRSLNFLGVFALFEISDSRGIIYVPPRERMFHG